MQRSHTPRTTQRPTIKKPIKARLTEAVTAAKMGDCSMLESVHQDFEDVCLPGLNLESLIMQLAPGYRVIEGICRRCGEFGHQSRHCDAPKSQQEINREPHHTWELMKRPLQPPPRMVGRQEGAYGWMTAPMSPREGAYGPPRHKPSVPASPLHTLPVYTDNTEPASLAALARRMDEKDAVQALRDERTDQTLEGIFRQVSTIVVGMCDKTVMQLSQSAPVEEDKPADVTPIMLADRAPPDWRCSGCWTDGRTRTYMPEKDYWAARRTMPPVRGAAGAGSKMFFKCEEDFQAGVRH